jgi:hypothetical protein
MDRLVLEALGSRLIMPKILLRHYCTHHVGIMIETLTHRPPINEPIIRHHINPRAKGFHSLHRLTNNYEAWGGALAKKLKTTCNKKIGSNIFIVDKF